MPGPADTKSAAPDNAVWAVLPIKSLSDVKSRLGAILSPHERRQLVAAMAEDVLSALKETRGLEGIAIITHDEVVNGWAGERGLKVIDDTSVKGLSAAVALAAETLKSKGATAILSVLADTPFATAQDFEALLTALGQLESRPSLLIAPSRDGDGSNALLVTPPDAMAFHYGTGSRAKHVKEAENRELVIRELDLAGLGHDIDTSADLADLAQNADKLPKNSSTRQFLTEQKIADRLPRK